MEQYCTVGTVHKVYIPMQQAVKHKFGNWKSLHPKSWSLSLPHFALLWKQLSSIYPHSRTHMNTIAVKYSAIPSYLHNSAFYRTLNYEEADSEIQIPTECFKVDDSVTNTVDLSHMLSVQRFWGLDELPLSMMDFYFRLRDSDWKRDELDEYPALRIMWNVFTQQSTLTYAMQNCNRAELVYFLFGISNRDDFSAMKCAASLGRLDYLIALFERGYVWNEETCSEAAERGHLSCLIFARENGCPWDKFTLMNAASNGHLDCIKYAVENGLGWLPDICNRAVHEGHLHCLEYAVLHGFPWDDDVSLEAAYGGQLECLQFALANGCPIHNDACRAAARSGHLDFLILLHQYNAPWNETASADAAAGGQLPCLQYLHENGCPWDEETPSAAASHGHEECLRYAINNGCNYDATLVFTATVGGDLGCLQFVVGEMGVYMDESVFADAVWYGHLDCLKYLLEMGCPIGDFNLENEFDFFILDVDHDTRDSRLLQCIEYAVHRGWRGDELFVNGVCQYQKDLPTCWKYIVENSEMFNCCIPTG